MLDNKIDALHDRQPELPERPKLPVRNPDHVYFAEEQKGWHGYVEWEKYPKKAKRAAEILSEDKFAGVSPLIIAPASIRLTKIISSRCPSSN